MKRLLTLAALAALLGGFGAAANAIETDTILLKGKVVMRITAGAGGASPADRAAVVRQRLQQSLTLPGLLAQDIVIRQARAGQEAAIYARDRLLVTVDPEMAQMSGQKEPLDLATTWTLNLRALLPRMAAESQRRPERGPAIAARPLDLR